MFEIIFIAEHELKKEIHQCDGNFMAAMNSLPVPSLRHFLESILLPQYLDLLTDSGYDTVHKCALLTNSDLECIGILPPGHRKRIVGTLEKFKVAPECKLVESPEVPCDRDPLPAILDADAADSPKAVDEPVTSSV